MKYPGARMWALMGLDRQHRGAGRKEVERAGYVDWQDDYFENVSLEFGLARCQTPDKKRKHLPTREYRAQQLEAARVEALCPSGSTPAVEGVEQQVVSNVSLEPSMTAVVKREQEMALAPVDVTSEPTKADMAETEPNGLAEYIEQKMQAWSKLKKSDPDERPGFTGFERPPGG
ncbi:hypothetical protein [Formivibrio citricus]|nr:hypothetical protein [Formivibrio citricus]